MYELMQAGSRTYYMDCPTKVGFFVLEEDKVVLIDSGSDRSAGRKVRQILDEKKWTPLMILNTHFHSDHIGGNRYLQGLFGIPAYCPGLDGSFAEHPLLEPMLLYGANPLEELKNKFLMAEESDVSPLTQEVLPEGLSIIPLPGHSMDMVGFRTSDDIVFAADALSSEAVLEKYQMGVLYDVEAYRKTLETLMEMKATLFVPAHTEVLADIRPLAEKNLRKVEEIEEKIIAFASTPSTFEEILKSLFHSFGLAMNASQYVLVGSTLRSYLTYLKNTGRLDYRFENNRMEWFRKA